MLFQTKTKSGKVMFRTEFESCVPLNDLDSLVSAGLNLFLDGKKVSPAVVRSAVKDTTPEIKSTLSKSRCVPAIDLNNLEFPLTSRTIVCITTGKVYRNQTEAAKDLNIDSAYISDCVCNNKEYKGYRFRRASDIV